MTSLMIIAVYVVVVVAGATVISAVRILGSVLTIVVDTPRVIVSGTVMICS